MTAVVAAQSQLPPTRGERKQRHHSSAYLKIGTFIGGICLLLQLVVLRIHNHTDENSASSSSSSSSSHRSTTGLSSVPSAPHRQPPSTDPILLVGLPRSGSLAFHQYFLCHGKPSVHYCCDGSSRTSFPCKESKTCGKCVLSKMASSQQEKNFDGCATTSTTTTVDVASEVVVWAQFDVETTDGWFLPQHFALGLLHQTYPNATWILNRRDDSTQWAKSVLHWHSMTRRLFNSFQLDFYPHPIQDPPDPSTKVTAKEIEIDVAKALTERVFNETEYARKLTLLSNIYDQHTQMIQEWTQQFPSHRLIEIVVDNEETDIPVTVLDEAFGFTSSGKCDEWSFESPDDDWKDFSFSL